VDCRRRYRELEKDSSKLLGLEKLKGIVKMFPTLTLDFEAEGRCIQAVDGDLRSLLAIFDSDSDGFLSEEDFGELVMFCHAWRANFYIKTDLPSKPVPVVPESPTLKAAARSILQPRQPTRAASEVALKVKAPADSALPRVNRRASGFGPRMLDLEPLPVQPRPAAASVPLPPAEVITPVKPSPKPSPATSRKTSKEKKSSKELCMGRRGSAPSVLNFKTDATRGAFYSCLSGYVTSGCSPSRESSPAPSSESEDDP